MNFRHYASIALVVILIVLVPLMWGIHQTEATYDKAFGNVESALGAFLVTLLNVAAIAVVLVPIGLLIYAIIRVRNSNGFHQVRANRHGNYPQLFQPRTGHLVELAPGNHAKLPDTFSYHNAPHVTVKEEAMPELPLLAESLHEQPTLETVIEELRPNSLEFVFGMDPLTGQLVKSTLPKAVHIQLVGASGQGKSRQATSILTQLTATNDPQHLHLALIDHEGETSSPFWGLPHVRYLADEPREASKVFRSLVKELDRRDVAHLAFPVLLIFCEEFLNLRRTMSHEQRDQALEDYTSLALRGRKRGMFLFSIGQTAYVEKTIRDAQAQFLSSMAFAVKPTAARSAGFTNKDLLNQLYSEKRPGQFLLERPSGDALLLAPFVDTSVVPSLLPTFSDPKNSDTEEVRNWVESGQQGSRNQVRNQQASAPEAALAQVCSLLGQGVINKAEIIQVVWGAKPGSSEKYRNAEQAYKNIMMQLAQQKGQ